MSTCVNLLAQSNDALDTGAWKFKICEITRRLKDFGNHSGEIRTNTASNVPSKVHRLTTNDGSKKEERRKYVGSHKNGLCAHFSRIDVSFSLNRSRCTNVPHASALAVQKRVKRSSVASSVWSSVPAQLEDVHRIGLTGDTEEGAGKVERKRVDFGLV